MGDRCDKFHSLEEGEAVYCGTGRVGLLPLCRGRFFVASDHPTGAVWQHRGLSGTFCPAAGHDIDLALTACCVSHRHNGLDNREEQLEENTTQQMNGNEGPAVYRDARWSEAR